MCAVELRNGKLTVGKIYAGFLVLENWKATRFGQIPGASLGVSRFVSSPQNGSLRKIYMKKIVSSNVPLINGSYVVTVTVTIINSSIKPQLLLPASLQLINVQQL